MLDSSSRSKSDSVIPVVVCGEELSWRVMAGMSRGSSVGSWSFRVSHEAIGANSR